MNKQELEFKHAEYDLNIDQWKFYKAAYAGTAEMLAHGVVKQLTDEGNDAYKKRLSTVFGFGLSEQLISLSISYIFSKPTTYDFEGLKDDKLFQLYIKNADKQGENFELDGQDRLLQSKIYGHVGCLVNKSVITAGETRTVAKDVSDNIYAYNTTFLPQSIWDWKYDLVNGSKVLTYLKLYDEIGRINIWTLDVWQIWIQDDKKEWVLDQEGTNTLAIIPFDVLRNGKKTGEMSGTSDLKEIARHDASLINYNASVDRVINFGCFPMLLVPVQKVGEKIKKILVDAAAVIGYDMKFHQSKPEWLKTEISAPIESIIKWEDVVITQAYKALFASFMNDTGGTAESGEAKKRAFQSFNAALARSSKMLEASEMRILGYWLDWQDKSEEIEKISISRPSEFDIQSLEDEIDNFQNAANMVQSERFGKLVQNKIVSKTLPEIGADDLAVVNDEIEKSKIVMFDTGGIDNANDDLNNE